jgi:hypothetical protein
MSSLKEIMKIQLLIIVVLRFRLGIIKKYSFLEIRREGERKREM